VTTRILRDPSDIPRLAVFLAARKLPLTVTITAGASRSNAQNRLSHRWYSDIARQMDDRTAEEVRAECKLQFGVPILLRDNGPFCAAWDKATGRLTYAEKLEAVRAFDLPVTRLMTTPQMTEYLDTLQRHWTQNGVRLADPEAMKYEEEFR
jgi:hypothetical protein